MAAQPLPPSKPDYVVRCPTPLPPVHPRLPPSGAPNSVDRSVMSGRQIAVLLAFVGCSVAGILIACLLGWTP